MTGGVVKLGAIFPTVNRWESGRVKPSPVAKQRIAKISRGMGDDGVDDPVFPQETPIGWPFEAEAFVGFGVSRTNGEKADDVGEAGPFSDTQK